MALKEPVIQAVLDEVRSCGLFGDTPDGPAECSFAGYKRVTLLDPQRNGDRVSWPVCEFGPARNTNGVAPAGWALFDVQGVMLKTQRAESGSLRRGVLWRVNPALRVEVDA